MPNVNVGVKFLELYCIVPNVSNYFELVKFMSSLSLIIMISTYSHVLYPSAGEQ